MSVKKYLTLNGLTYFLSKIKSTMADELDGKSDVGHTHTKSDITDLPTLATVATSGSYTDLDDKPTINDSTITIQKNGSTVDTFTTNGSNKTINIPVPTKTSDLTNDSNFVDTSNSAVASGITSAKVTDYDSHIADTDIHVTTADKTKWNNGVTQSYVFRYSGTAVVPNSTIAYSTIDNTDNIKSGDKILDVDGKLFEITAVDTTNQTVTVSSALIDLALDSNVVHTSGNETISGDKVFNNRLIKNIDVVLGTAPSTGKFSNIDIADNNKASLLQILGGVYDTGNSYARFFVQNKTADDGTGLSPTGTIRTCGFNINLPATSTSEGQGSITPRANKTTDFGLLSYQWRNLWCEKLFLNGTQLDPSAFVTTDTAQTISGNKTFSSNVNVYNSDATATTPNLYLKSSKIEISSQGNTSGDQNLAWLDKNNTSYAYVKGAIQSNGSSVKIRTIAKDSSDNSVINELQILANTNGRKIIFPTYSNEIELGDSTYKWKSFNGVEPSLLSLPSQTYVDISSYFTNTGTGEHNTYTAPSNGWIFLRLGNISGCQADIFDTNNNRMWGQSTTGSVEQITIPILSGCTLRTQWNTNSTVFVDTARFYPCQGNV